MPLEQLEQLCVRIPGHNLLLYVASNLFTSFVVTLKVYILSMHVQFEYKTIYTGLFQNQ
jgi:hypothetical protein